MSRTSALKALATRIQHDVFGGGDLAAIDDLYAPELTARIKELVTMLRTAFPDLTIQIDHLIAEDDKVACGWTATGTQLGWFFNVPPTRARARWSGVSIYVTDAAGKVASMAGTWDMFGLMKQLRAALPGASV